MTYSNKDGIIKTKKCDKGKFITYIDENDFIKTKRALRTYFMRSYKDLEFNVLNKIKNLDQEDGDYEIDLYTDTLVKKVYGQIKLKYFIKGNVIVIKEIVPKQILIDLYKKILNTYKGIPYRNKYDLFKIKMILGEEI